MSKKKLVEIIQEAQYGYMYSCGAEKVTFSYKDIDQFSHDVIFLSKKFKVERDVNNMLITVYYND